MVSRNRYIHSNEILKRFIKHYDLGHPVTAKISCSGINFGATTFPTVCSKMYSGAKLSPHNSQLPTRFHPAPKPHFTKTNNQKIYKKTISPKKLKILAILAARMTVKFAVSPLPSGKRSSSRRRNNVEAPHQLYRRGSGRERETEKKRARRTSRAEKENQSSSSLVCATVVTARPEYIQQRSISPHRQLS